MRRWLGRTGLILIASALVLDVMLLAAGDPAALPDPLAAASDQVLPWAQDSILPLAQGLGLIRPLEADVAVAAESASDVTGAEPASPLDATPTASPSLALAATPDTGVLAPAVLESTSSANTTVPISAPARIAARAIGLDAPIVPVGVDNSGAMGTPRTSWQVGWYGPRPGEDGNALFAGHVDWVTEGKVVKGAFYALRKLKAGDVITITAADGSDTSYRVEWNRYYTAKAAPVDEIAGPTTEPAITLITCGGPFDRNLKSYLGRWVVRAILIAE